MAQDPYEILGLAKDASEAEIKSAYRKLAKAHHPDLNPGKESETRFRDIGAAYGILGDADKRARFDRGEIDMDGQPRQPQFYSNYAGGPSGRTYRQAPPGSGRQGSGPEDLDSNGFNPEGFDPRDFGDIFGSMFGGGFAQNPQGVTLDARYSIEIDFLEAAKGGQKRVTMPDGRVLDLKIPAGIAEGQQLRLKGQGNTGRDGAAGDAYVEVHVLPHPLFTRQGNDILVELPVGFHESVLGSRVPVPTVHGEVEMAVPAGSSTGRVLRLKGKGLNGGDELVRLRIVMPPVVDPVLREAVETWAKTHPFDPRAAAKGTS